MNVQETLRRRPRPERHMYDQKPASRASIFGKNAGDLRAVFLIFSHSKQTQGSTKTFYYDSRVYSIDSIARFMTILEAQETLTLLPYIK